MKALVEDKFLSHLEEFYKVVEAPGRHCRQLFTSLSVLWDAPPLPGRRRGLLRASLVSSKDAPLLTDWWSMEPAW